MFKNYARLALRNIGRKKLYSIINVTGLSIASAFCILVYLYVQHERSFDAFHTNSSELYRVELSDQSQQPVAETKTGFFSFLSKDVAKKNMIVTPVIFAGDLQRNFPEINQTVRLANIWSAVVRQNGQSFKEEHNGAYVDTSFFNTFNYPLKEGNAAHAFAGRNSIVLSERLAEKYFGKTEAVGKTLLMPTNDSMLYTVSAVVKNFPANSSFQYDLLMPRESDANYAGHVQAGLNTSTDLLVIELKKGTNMAAFQQKLDAFANRYFAPSKEDVDAGAKSPAFHIYLRPFTQAHYNASGNWGHYTDLESIYELICLAAIILVIACLNYILLTLTGTVSRSQEVGIRKTVGAPRRHIILQFYIETQALAFFSVIIGFVLAVICLPLFGSLTGSELTLAFFSFKQVAVLLGILSLALGISAGIYPALVMSGLKPLNMMRSFSAYRLNPFLSKFLIVTQFSVCIILVISSLAIGKQMRYMSETKLGFDADQIVSVENPFSDDKTATYLLKDRLTNYASHQPALAGVSATYFPFGGYGNINNHLIGGEKTMVEVFDIDYNYFSFYKIPIVMGREFSSQIATDSMRFKLTDDQVMKGASAARQNVVVNETLYKMLRQPPLNEYNREVGGSIIGVCKDYHSDDLTKKIGPAYHRIARNYVPFFSFKIKAGQNIATAMSDIKTNWAKLTGGEPFSYKFLDEDVAKSYEVYLRWMRTIVASCVLAIVIACMGLFGLSALTTLNRIKEIGIRKVMGASVKELFMLLNRSTVVMAIISFIVAVPVSIFFVNSWLENFAYRINVDWTLFAIAGVISIVTALIAVSYHTIKTAKANPVKSLRTE